MFGYTDMKMSTYVSLFFIIENRLCIKNVLMLDLLRFQGKLFPSFLMGSTLKGKKIVPFKSRHLKRVLSY